LGGFTPPNTLTALYSREIASLHPLIANYATSPRKWTEKAKNVLGLFYLI
jgi:hypothetical protein